MDLGLKGKRALIGGSSTGLGRAVAEALAAEGCDVVLNARGEDRLRDTAEAIADRHGVRTVPVAADLSTASEARRLAREARAALGGIDILVTNNGGPPPGPFEEHDLDTWERGYRLTLESVLALTKELLPGMKERGWGRILTITSIAVKQPVDGLILSNALRAGVTGFARTLANEVAAHGITVNNLMPGYTRTARLDHLAARISDDRGVPTDEVFEDWADEVPAGRVGEPHEFGALAAFLASEKASYVTAQSIAVDGGWIRSLL